MQKLRSPSISNFSIACARIAMFFTLMSCASNPLGSGKSDESDAYYNAPIDYPFVDRTNPLGENGPEDPFVIKSQIGATQYEVKIPGAGRDYDIEVPLADLQGAGAVDTSAGVIPMAQPPQRPQITDQEFQQAMPRLPVSKDRALVEGAFGVGETQGPKQSPSYALELARINQYYKQRQYEYGLVEVNNLLAFYPTSAQLFKMKGTLLMKLRNPALAEIAWSRAVELEPGDRRLRAALDGLRARIAETRQAAAAVAPAVDAKVQPIGLPKIKTTNLAPAVGSIAEPASKNLP